MRSAKVAGDLYLAAITVILGQISGVVANSLAVGKFPPLLTARADGWLQWSSFHPEGLCLQFWILTVLSVYSLKI